MIDNLNISPLINRICKCQTGIGLSACHLSQRAINKIFNGSIEDQWNLFPYLSKFGILLPHSLLSEWRRYVWKKYSNQIKTIAYAEIIKLAPKAPLHIQKAYIDKVIQDLVTKPANSSWLFNNIMNNIVNKHPQTFDEFWDMLDNAINEINLDGYSNADDMVDFWACYMCNHVNPQAWDNYITLNNYKAIGLFNKKPKAFEKLYNKSVAALQPTNRN